MSGKKKKRRHQKQSGHSPSVAKCTGKAAAISKGSWSGNRRQRKRTHDEPHISQGSAATVEIVQDAFVTPMRKKRRIEDCITIVTPKSKKRRREEVFLDTTPKGKKRRRLSCKRLDFFADMGPSCKAPWSKNELEALVQYLMLHTDGTHWVAHNDQKFWEAAGKFIQSQIQSFHCRSGNACRTKVTVGLSAKFSCPAEADRFYNSSEHQVPRISSPAEVTSQQQCLTPVEVFNDCKSLLSKLSAQDQIEFLSQLCSWFDESQNNPPLFLSDFLKLAFQGAQHAKECDRLNIIYLIAKGLGTMRPDKSDSLLPAKRMPMGLIEYAASFYTAKSIQKVVSCPVDYKLWCETMFTLFGTKWSRIHVGPMWSAVPVTQDQQISQSSKSKTITEARINIPAPSLRTIQRGIASSSFSIGSELQVTVLEEAARLLPDAWWWVKADGCDLIAGLKESVKQEWSGDVDLNDGKIAELHREYIARLKFAEEFGAKERKDRLVVLADLCKLQDDLRADFVFLLSVLEKKSAEYSAKVNAGSSTTKTLHSLAWNVDELQRLIECCRKAVVDMQALVEVLQEDVDSVRANVPRQLANIKKSLALIVKGVYRYQRTPATHVLVVMISTETRNKKPYALPVQCIPYSSLKDKAVRDIFNSVIREMTKLGMKVSGEATNGEWNTLRCSGNTRPLSILQIRSDVRTKYKSMSVKKMKSMITPICNLNGTVTAELPDPAISEEMLKKIVMWATAGKSEEDIINSLRLETIPQGYKAHTWVQGKDEKESDKLRSILAQCQYTYLVQWYHDVKGIPFRDHLYVPESHPETGETFCEREDEGHVFKRIGQSTREGGPSAINLQHFMEALYDPTTDLTYPALTGSRKQSVSDVERLFSAKMENFMRSKGYGPEEKYIQVVRNWRRSCDERGLSNKERERFNKAFLDYILDDLIPWHNESDFSHLEVNRPISGVCGFTRETLHALIADIEGREWRRKNNEQLNIPTEHPRSSTTDDVECFFSILRDMIGPDFTLKQVQLEWRKACIEMSKRLDPSLPFYYHTSSHDRFYEGDRPSFDMPVQGKSHNNPRELRPRRSELLSNMDSGRTTLPVAGSRSIRMQFHNLPVELPPPPGTQPHVTDHTYT